jgi:3-hydroxybutyryl-CoA dehydrogenase
MAGRVSVDVAGQSHAFPSSQQLPGRVEDIEYDIRILLGDHGDVSEPPPGEIVLVELGLESLGVHTGEQRGQEGGRVLGFSRFRIGSCAPSDLVELVVQPRTDPGAVSAATALFEALQLQVAGCRDFPGRVLNRLLRPYLNEALKALDEGLATADDIDLTVRLGLGYPHGPIELVESSGLADHHAVSKLLLEATGDPSLTPARRSAVAAARQRGRRT